MSPHWTFHLLFGAQWSVVAAGNLFNAFSIYPNWALCMILWPLSCIKAIVGGSLATHNFISRFSWRWMRSVLVQQLKLKHYYFAKRYFLSSGWERTHHRLSICIIVYVLRVSNPLLGPHNVSFNIANERMYVWMNESISMLSSATLMRRTKRAFIWLGQNYVLCARTYVSVYIRPK